MGFLGSGGNDGDRVVMVICDDVMVTIAMKMKMILSLQGEDLWAVWDQVDTMVIACL